MTAGDRAVSALYVNGRTRAWSMDLDRLPNQGQLDTSVPSHVVDLDALARACRWSDPDAIPVPAPPRLPLRRRLRWTWWEALAFVGGVALIVALVLSPLKTVLTLAVGAVIAYAVAAAHWHVTSRRETAP